MAKGQKHKKYTPEFKIKVVETMRKEKLCYSVTAKMFDVSSDSVVKRWERIYLEEGKEGFYVEHREHKSIGRYPKPRNKGEEDLIAEVQRLRAENDY